MKLPLFPLNLVLFPGMPLRLHIFEERYKEMVNFCQQEDSPFGIVLIESGHAEGSSLARPHTVGTTAHIVETQELQQGRMNLRIEGRERFQINSVDTRSQSYLTGDVDMIPFSTRITPAAMRGHNLLKPLIERYLKALEKIGTIEFDSAILPQEPLALAYLAAMLVDADNNAKQQLLEANDTKDLLKQLIQQYRKEVVIIDILMSPPAHLEEDDFPFSWN